MPWIIHFESSEYDSSSINIKFEFLVNISQRRENHNHSKLKFITSRRRIIFRWFKMDYAGNDYISTIQCYWLNIKKNVFDLEIKISPNF